MTSLVVGWLVGWSLISLGDPTAQHTAHPITLLPCFVGTITPGQFSDSDRVYTRSLVPCRVPSPTSAVMRVKFMSDLDEFVTYFSRESRRLQLQNRNVQAVFTVNWCVDV